MTRKTKWKRFIIGLGLVLVVLIVSFSIILQTLSNVGATPLESSASYYGDDLLSHPVVVWTHAETIQAKPEQVWQWIAQIGDTRGGFYSYTFIENLIAQGSLYHNADSIHPEWQDPQPGDFIITPMLAVKDVEKGKHFFASSLIPGIGWTWLWQIAPDGENTTRLQIRMRIQVPPEAASPVLGNAISVSGFVMEKGMLDGLKARAEGRIPPSYDLALGFILWMIAFITGIVCAVFFLKHLEWKIPLATGLAGVMVLMIFTFIQPAMWIRIVLDLVLIGGTYFAYRKGRAPSSQG